jgi:hypothetical protein
MSYFHWSQGHLLGLVDVVNSTYFESERVHTNSKYVEFYTSQFNQQQTFKADFMKSWAYLLVLMPSKWNTGSVHSSC